jgi:hypothetical protein
MPCIVQPALISQQVGQAAHPLDHAKRTVVILGVPIPFGQDRNGGVKVDFARLSLLMLAGHFFYEVRDFLGRNFHGLNIPDALRNPAHVHSVVQARVFGQVGVERLWRL